MTRPISGSRKRRPRRRLDEPGRRPGRPAAGRDCRVGSRGSGERRRRGGGCSRSRGPRARRRAASVRRQATQTQEGEWRPAPGRAKQPLFAAGPAEPLGGQLRGHLRRRNAGCRRSTRGRRGRSRPRPGPRGSARAGPWCPRLRGSRLRASPAARRRVLRARVAGSGSPGPSAYDRDGQPVEAPGQVEQPVEGGAVAPMGVVEEKCQRALLLGQVREQPIEAVTCLRGIDRGLATSAPSSGPARPAAPSKAARVAPGRPAQSCPRTAVGPPRSRPSARTPASFPHRSQALMLGSRGCSLEQGRLAPSGSPSSRSSLPLPALADSIAEAIRASSRSRSKSDGGGLVHLPAGADSRA